MATSEAQPVPEREGFPPGVPCWIDTDQPDPGAALYSGLFGWQFTERLPPEAGASYRVAALNGKDVAAVRSTPQGDSPNPAWNTYVGVASADETVARVRNAGGAVIGELSNLGGAGRMAICTDPSGAAFRLWQPGTLQGHRR